MSTVKLNDSRKFSISSFFIHICMTVCAVSSQARGGHWIPCNFTTTWVLGSESRSSGKSQCSQPLYHLSSPSLRQEFNLKISFCSLLLLTILAETQICIIITIAPFLGKNVWIQAGERTPGVKACTLPEDPGSVPGGSTASGFCRHLYSHAHKEK